jgi:hypothetical protein
MAGTRPRPTARRPRRRCLISRALAAFSTDNRCS